MFERHDLRSETLTDLAAFAGGADFGRAVCGRFASPPEGLHHAFNANQIASKTWLLDRLYETLGGEFATVYVLGGWYGALGALLLGDPRYSIARVLSFDIDPDCARVAEGVNEDNTARGRFTAITADAGAIDYDLFDPAARDARREGIVRRLPNLVINTSCEHMTETAAWYDRIPIGMPQAFQSNDYFDCPEHVNCVADLGEFKTQLPMSELNYEGTLKRRRYSRFMLIGRK